MRTSSTFRKFIEIDKNFSQSIVKEATKIGSMPEFQKGVRDFIYLPEYNSGFIALSEMNIVKRMDSYFNNMKMPWDKSNGKSEGVLTGEAVATVGQLQHYKI